MSESENETGATRREFLQKSATTAAAGVAVSTLSYLPSTAAGLRNIIGANDRINIGHVGVGVQGYGAHCRLLYENAQKNNTVQVALCDLYGRNLKKAQETTKVADNRLYKDYRKFLESKDIDAVVVATSDNWHTDVAVSALEAGKHVYVEKPMCKTIEEAFRIHDAVKKTKLKLQVGSQGCTDQKWHIAARMVREGKIGPVVVGQGSYMRNTGNNKQWAKGVGGEWDTYGRYDTDAGPTATGDAHVDWETFRKGRGPKDWDPDRFFHWRKFWDYGSGLVGDLFPHRLHPLFIAMALPTTGLDGFPLRVSSGGGLYVQKINPYHPDRPDREVPDFTNIQVDFADRSLMAMSSTINEQGWQDTIRGLKGTLYFGGNSVKLVPERSYADEAEEVTEQNNGTGEDIAIHESNWISCIRDGKEPNCNIDIAVRVQVMISLAELAYRQSKTFTFDPATRKYKG